MSRRSLVFTALLLVISLLAVLFQIDFDFSDKRVQQAAIAAAVVMSGWIVTFAFREGSQLIDRVQKSRDLQLAFRAEIEDYSETLDDGDQQEAIDRIRQRLRENDKKPIFFPLISEPIIFEKLASEVHILPEAVISYAIRFYSMLSDVRLFAEELRGEEFKALGTESKIDAFSDYIMMRATCCEFAHEALVEIDVSLGEKITDSDRFSHSLHQAERVTEIRAWLNSRTSDRVDQKSGVE